MEDVCVDGFGDLTDSTHDSARELRRLVEVMREIRDLIFFFVWAGCPQQTFWPHFERALKERQQATAEDLLYRKGGGA